MVVLDEVVTIPSSEQVAAVGLLEEAAGVAVDDRFDQHRAVQACRQRAHGAQSNEQARAAAAAPDCVRQA